MSLFDGRKSRRQEPLSTGEIFRFKLNQRIRMQFSLAGGHGTYMSSVQDVFEHVVRVYLPAPGGVPLDVPLGAPINVTVFDNSGMYDFISKVTGLDRGRIAYLELAKPTRVKRYQKRKSVRTRAMLPAFYLVALSSRSMLESAAQESGHVMTRDISENGLCLLMPNRLTVGMTLELRVQLPVRVVKVLGEVVRVDRDQFSDKYFTGVIIQQISDEDLLLIQEFVERNEGKK
jgi:c-di-GMP-binding flagellar brake protein YcgR